MNKAIILLCLCFIITIAFTYAAGTVEFSWADNTIVPQTTTRLHIKTSNIDMKNGLYFIPRHINNGDSVYTFDMTENDKLYTAMIGGTIDDIEDGIPSMPCFDIITGQIVATMEKTSNPITFNLLDESYTFESIGFKISIQRLGTGPNTFYGYNNDQTLGQFDMYCAFTLPFQSQPQSELISTFYYDDINHPNTTNIYSSTNITLSFPKDGFITPSIQFLSLDFKQNHKSDITTSSLIEFSFNTNTPGLYWIDSINAPRFTAISQSTGEMIDLWCSSGDNKNAARIALQGQRAVVFVQELPQDSKNGFKCSLYFQDASQQSVFVASQRSSITITYGTSVVSRTLDYKLRPASVIGNFITLTIPKIEIEIRTQSTVFSSTPIHTNSTIEIQFDNDIDVNALVLKDGMINYRGYECTTFNATIILQSNSIILQDILPTTNNGINMDCIFEFSGVNALEFKQDKKVTFFTVIIDGITTTSIYGRGTSNPLYYHPHFNVSDIRTTTILNDNIYEITQSFDISDSYRTIPVTPRKPIVQLSFNGAIPYTVENYSEQVTCRITTPTNTAYNNLPLEFDSKLYIWTAPIISIIDIEIFTIYVECKYNVQRREIYGLDNTESFQFIVQVFDLIDNIRFSQSFGNTSEFGPIKVRATQQPNDDQLPQKPVLYTSIAGHITIGQGNNYNERLEQGSQWWKEIFQKSINETLITNTTNDKLYQDWDITPIGSIEIFPMKHFSHVHSFAQNTYININAADDWNNYIFNELQNEWLPFTVRGAEGTISDYYISEPSFSLHVETVLLRQYYIVFSPNNTAPTGYQAGYQALKPAGDWSWRYNQQRIVNQDVMYSHLNNVFYEQDVYSTTLTSLPKPEETMFANRIINCGWNDGLLLINNTSNRDTNSIYNWTEYSNPLKFSQRWILCHDGDTCTTSSDCSGSKLCQESKCVTIPKSIPKFVDLTASYVPNYFLDQKYYNNGYIVSYMLSFIMIIVCLVV